MQHFLRVKGGGSTWHHAGQQAYLQEEAARQAQHGTAASSSQAPPEPKAPPSRPAPSTPASDPRASATRLPQAVPAPPPKLMDAPHRSTLPPKEPDQAPPTMEDLCAEKDFFDWIVAIADLQALTAKEVTGVLQPSEFATIWNTRLQALKKLPRLLLGLQTLHKTKKAVISVGV